MGEPEVDDWGVLVEPGVFGAGPVIPPLPDVRTRSPKWPAFLKAFLGKNPQCRGCGRKAVTGHHDVPFHVRPELELDEANILPVCLPCHFVLCHSGDWRLWVKTAREDLDGHRPVVEAAEQLASEGSP